MNKLISLFIFTSLLFLVSADQAVPEDLNDQARDETDDIGIYGEDIEYISIGEDTLPHEEEQVNWADQPIVVVIEGPMPTVDLIPNNEPSTIDVQVKDDGEVIVDNTEPDVVLADSDETEQSDTPVLFSENEEFTFGNTQGTESTQEKPDDGEEENTLKTEDSDDVDTANEEVPVLELENGENADVPNGNEEEDYTFRTEESDDTTDPVVPVLVSENEEYNFEATPGVVSTQEKPDDGEEDGLKTEDSDDVDVGNEEIPVLGVEDGETGEIVNVPVVNEEEDGKFETEESDDTTDPVVPVLVSENDEYDFEPTPGVVSTQAKPDDGEEENGIKADGGDDVDVDVDNSEIPVLETESGETVDVAVVNEEEDGKFETEESDDTTDPVVPVLVSENEEYNFETTSGFVPTGKVTDDAEEEENSLKTEGSEDVDVDDSDVPVLETQEDTPGVVSSGNVTDDAEEEENALKTEDSEEIDTVETSDIPVLEVQEGTPVVESTQTRADDGEEEQNNFKTEDSDDVDVDNSEIPVLLLSENEEFDFEPTQGELAPENNTIDETEDGVKADDEDDIVANESIPTVDVKEDGFLP